MKKVIRLSENDLINIVKRIVNEQEEVPYVLNSKQYETKRRPISPHAFTEVTQDKLGEFLKWHPGGSWVDVQKFLMNTYGLPRLYSDEQLKTVNPKNSNLNLFKEFVRVIEACLYVAAELNLSGKAFTKTFDIKTLNTHLGGRFGTLDWVNAFQELPKNFADLKVFQEFVGKVIDARRKAIGLPN
jgi:hypothetical protein